MTLTDIISKITLYAKKAFISDNSSTAAISVTQSGTGPAITTNASIGIGTTNTVIPGIDKTIALKSSTGTSSVRVEAFENARIDLATSIPNAFTIINLQKNAGNPYLEIASGPAVQATYYDSPIHYLRTSGFQRLNIKTNGQVRFVPLASPPSGAEPGDVYYDGATNKLRCYDGTNWNDLF